LFSNQSFIQFLLLFDKVTTALMLESQEPASGAFGIPTNAPVVSKISREFEKKFAPAGAIQSPLSVPIAFTPRLKIRGQIFADSMQRFIKFPVCVHSVQSFEMMILEGHFLEFKGDWK
jgi:hypothetical protein